MIPLPLSFLVNANSVRKRANSSGFGYSLLRIFKITAAYPNPFNPSINIDYLINNQSNIKFHFYDINGRLLEIVDKGFLYPGNYTLIWEPDFIPSGQYFIVISDGIQFHKEKITLIK